MAQQPPPRISAAVEGLLDDVVARRLIAHVGGTPGPVYGKNGKGDLIRQLPGFYFAANTEAWLVLLDLDDDARCAPAFVDHHRPIPPLLCLRVVVREVEAWLLADRDRIARFLSVPVGHITGEPETLADPKREMVAIASRSRRKQIKEDLVPSAGSGRETGRAYDAALIDFVKREWRPNIAAQRSKSLRGAINCLRQLASV